MSSVWNCPNFSRAATIFKLLLMKTVTGRIISAEPVSLTRAATLLSNFASLDNGASQDVSAYLQRAAAAFTELKSIHREIDSSSLEETKPRSDVTRDRNPTVELDGRAKAIDDLVGKGGKIRDRKSEAVSDGESIYVREQDEIKEDKKEKKGKKKKDEDVVDEKGKNLEDEEKSEERKEKKKKKSKKNKEEDVVNEKLEEEQRSEERKEKKSKKKKEEDVVDEKVNEKLEEEQSNEERKERKKKRKSDREIGSEEKKSKKRKKSKESDG